jgi:hypothetical protein
VLDVDIAEDVNPPGPAVSSLVASDTATSISSSIDLSFCGAPGRAGKWIMPMIGFSSKGPTERGTLSLGEGGYPSNIFSRKGHPSRTSLSGSDAQTDCASPESIPCGGPRFALRAPGRMREPMIRALT